MNDWMNEWMNVSLCCYGHFYFVRPCVFFKWNPVREAINGDNNNNYKQDKPISTIKYCYQRGPVRFDIKEFKKFKKKR